jgi:hypothetical protein
MRIIWRHRLLHQKEKNMEHIDDQGLPEEEMQLIAAFVEF